MPCTVYHGPGLGHGKAVTKDERIIIDGMRGKKFSQAISKSLSTHPMQGECTECDRPHISDNMTWLSCSILSFVRVARLDLKQQDCVCTSSPGLWTPAGLQPCQLQKADERVPYEMRRDVRSCIMLRSQGTNLQSYVTFFEGIGVFFFISFI